MIKRPHKDQSVGAAALAGLIALGLAASCAAVPVLEPDSKPPIVAVPGVDKLGIEPGGTGVLPIILEFPGTHHLNAQPSPAFAVREPSGLTAFG